MPITSCGADTDPVSINLFTLAQQYDSSQLLFQVRKCLIFGLFNNVAELQSDHHYITLHGRQRVKIHPSSVFCDKEKPKHIVFSELIATGRTYVRTVSAIEQEWVDDLVVKFKNATTSSSFTSNRHGMHELNAAVERAGSSSSSSYLNNSSTADPFQYSPSIN